MPNQHRLHAQPEKTTCLGSPTIACAQPNKTEAKPKTKKQTKAKKSWVGSHAAWMPTKKEKAERQIVPKR